MQRDSEAESVQQALQGNINCTILNEYPAYDSPNTTAPLGYDVIDSINTIHYGLLGNFNHGTPLSYTTATNTLNRSHNAHHAICAMDFYDTHDEWLYNNIPDENNGFDNLTNSIYPAVFYSISCTNMPFDMYNTFEGTINLGRSFTCHNIGGGPAYLGNTRSGYVTSSTRLFCSFVDSIINNIRNNHLGIAEAKSKFGYRNNYLRHCHNLLGCPEMSLYTHVPNQMNNIIVNHTYNQMTITTSIDSIESRICLSGIVNGVYRQFTYTDRSNVVFDTVPEPYTLVVSRPNYIPYIQNSDTCFLQNVNITNNHTYDGCGIFFIGSEVSPLSPYGSVTIENGGDVTINIGDTVIIKNDFEVKIGGQLLIH